MKIVAESPSFVQAIDWVVKGLDRKSSDEYITLKISPNGAGSLHFEGKETYFKKGFNVTSISTPLEEDLYLALDGGYLERLGRSLSGDKGLIEISKDSSDKKSPLLVSSTRQKFTVQMREYVKKSVPSTIEVGTVSSKEFLDKVSKISKLCDTDNSAQQSFLDSVEVIFKPSDKKLHFFATDRYALGIYDIDFEPAGGDDAKDFMEYSILLPARSAQAVKSNGEDISLVVEKLGKSRGKNTYRFGYQLLDGSLALFSLKNGEPSKNSLGMKEIDEKSVVNSFTIETRAFKDSMKRLSLVNNSPMSFHVKIDDSGITFTDNDKSNSIAVEPTNIESQEPLESLVITSSLEKNLSLVDSKEMKVKILKFGNGGALGVTFTPINSEQEEDHSTFTLSVYKKV